MPSPAAKAARASVAHNASPVAVIINRDGAGDAAVEAYCAAENIPILLRIPLERALAEGMAHGKPLIAIRPEYQVQLVALWEELPRRVMRGTP